MLSAWIKHQIVNINIQALSMVSIYLNSPFIKVDLPPLWLAPLYDDFKTSPLPTSLFLQVHEYDYDNAPSTVVSCPSLSRQTYSPGYLLAPRPN